MTTPAQPPQQQRSDQQAAAVLVPLLAAGVTAAGLAAALATAAGVTVAVAQGVVALAGAWTNPAGGIGPALAQTITTERAYRALYLVNAARRVRAAMADGKSLTAALAAERHNFAAHLHAQTNRRKAAAQVDKQAARHGLLLGWKARMDSRTSAECAAANGRNFTATNRPLIGWPGAVHPHCRCRAVAPYAGAGMVGDLVTAERKAATG